MFLRLVCRAGMNALRKISWTFTEFRDWQIVDFGRKNKLCLTPISLPRKKMASAVTTLDPQILLSDSADSSWSVRRLFIRCLRTLREVSADFSLSVLRLFMRCPQTLREVSADTSRITVYCRTWICGLLIRQFCGKKFVTVYSIKTETYYGRTCKLVHP